MHEGVPSMCMSILGTAANDVHFCERRHHHIVRADIRDHLLTARARINLRRDSFFFNRGDRSPVQKSVVGLRAPPPPKKKQKKTQQQKTQYPTNGIAG